MASSRDVYANPSAKMLAMSASRNSKSVSSILYRYNVAVVVVFAQVSLPPIVEDEGVWPPNDYRPLRPQPEYVGATLQFSDY
jgi:hypothetical protein